MKNMVPQTACLFLRYTKTRLLRVTLRLLATTISLLKKKKSLTSHKNEENNTY